MLATLFLVVLGLITPTFVDRSDIDLNTGQVLMQRSITQQPLFNGGGFFRSTIEIGFSDFSEGEYQLNVVLPSPILDTSATIGLVFELSATYEPDANNILRYQPLWSTRAGVNRQLGFFVRDELGEVVYLQLVPYPHTTADIRVLRNGEWIEYYLNGDLLYTRRLEGMNSLRGLIQRPQFASNPELERGDILRE